MEVTASMVKELRERTGAGMMDCKKVLVENFETKIFRFPGGAFEGSYNSYKAALHERGYDYINWNVSTGDSEYNGVPASLLIQNAKDGSLSRPRQAVKWNFAKQSKSKIFR